MTFTWKNTPTFFSTILLLSLVSVLYLGCVKAGSIKVGFAAQLTGRQADLGVQERYGVELAVEEINSSGGISGRPIQLITRDDLGTAEGARNAVNDLIKEGVVAVIGHATSQQTLHGRELTEAASVVMMSPTASTPALSGKDDYFIRIMTSFSERTPALTQRLFKRGVTRLAVLYDLDNAAFSETHVELISKTMDSLGGKLTFNEGFSSEKAPDFRPIVERMRASGADGVFVIASDIDTPMVAQQIRLLGWNARIVCAGWAMTETLLQNGGKAVEGVMSDQSYDMDSPSPDLQAFKAKYLERFGRPAKFYAAFAYETTKVLAEALKKTGGKAEGLKQALLQTKDFKGLISSFSIDQYGDVGRPFYLMEIRNMKIVKVDSMPSDTDEAKETK